jgi:hypothetical protein
MERIRRLEETQMRTIAITILILATAPAFAQQIEHAPTAAQCQADVAVWYSNEIATEYMNAQTAWVTDGKPNKTEGGKMSFTEATARMHEMFECQLVDKGKVGLYHEAGTFFYGIYADRAIDFIERHHLWAEFRKEDAEGLR